MITTKKVIKNELNNSLKIISDPQPTILTPVTIKTYGEVIIILKKILTSFSSITLIIIKN